MSGGAHWVATIRKDLKQIDDDGSHAGGGDLATRPALQWIKDLRGFPPGRVLFLRPSRAGRNENAPARNGDCLIGVTRATWTNDATGAEEDVTAKVNMILGEHGFIAISENDRDHPVGQGDSQFMICVVVEPGQHIQDHTVQLHNVFNG